MAGKGLEGLEVWQKARGLMVTVHKEVIPLLPPEEKWDLAHQIRRSSKSVMANIAEGYGRYYYQDNVRFCYNARGSLDETINHLVTALDLGYIPQTLYEELRDRSCNWRVSMPGPSYIPQTLYEELRDQADEVRRMLNGYIAFLKRKKQGENEPGSQLAIHEVHITYDLNNP